MLKKVEIPRYGPFVFGRRRPASRAPTMRAPMPLLAVPPPRSYDAIKADASRPVPLFAAESNVLGNDRWGDCTCAGTLHLEALFSAAAGRAWRMPTINDAAWLYAHVTNPAFNPATGANDDGADEQTVLEFWRTRGAYSDGSGKIISWSGVDATNPDAVRAAIFNNQNVYLGVELPAAWVANEPSKSGFVWDVAGDPDPENGHCIVAYGYNSQGVLIDTWGMFGIITWAALAKYCSGASGELYTVVAA